MILLLTLMLHTAAPDTATKCDISIRVDSIVSSKPLEQNKHKVAIYWNAFGYADTCWSQDLICVDAICHTIKLDSSSESIGFPTPWSSYQITLYGSNDLSVDRGYYASTMYPMWFQSKGFSSSSGIEEFEVYRGKIDSARLEYTPYNKAYVDTVKRERSAYNNINANNADVKYSPHEGAGSIILLSIITAVTIITSSLLLF
jgi:hypothetical protein